MAIAPDPEACRRRNIELLMELLEQLSSTSENERAREDFDAFLKRFGFVSCACLNLPALPHNEVTLVEVSRQGSVFWQEYRALRLHRADPVVARAAHAKLCFSWSDVEASGHLGQPDKRVFELARRFGHSDGISVPIRRSGEDFTIVSLIGRPPRMSQSIRLVIYLAVTAAYTQFNALFHCPAGQGSPLTRRQTEIVTWLAIGKSDWEISQILGVSPKTVNFHVENIKRKYGVGTRIQAIVAALREGLISHVAHLSCDARER